MGLIVVRREFLGDELVGLFEDFGVLGRDGFTMVGRVGLFFLILLVPELSVCEKHEIKNTNIKKPQKINFITNLSVNYFS